MEDFRPGIIWRGTPSVQFPPRTLPVAKTVIPILLATVLTVFGLILLGQWLKAASSNMTAATASASSANRTAFTPDDSDFEKNKEQRRELEISVDDDRPYMIITTKIRTFVNDAGGLARDARLVEKPILSTSVEVAPENYSRIRAAIEKHQQRKLSEQKHNSFEMVINTLDYMPSLNGSDHSNNAAIVSLGNLGNDTLIKTIFGQQDGKCHNPEEAQNLLTASNRGNVPSNSAPPQIDPQEQANTRIQDGMGFGISFALALFLGSRLYAWLLRPSTNRS